MKYHKYLFAQSLYSKIETCLRHTFLFKLGLI